MADSKRTSSETIVAISTPPGEGSIGIVRLSGPLAVNIASLIFTSQRGVNVSAIPSYRLTLGSVRDPLSGSVIDQSMLVLMRAPRTYTGEDMAEFQAHGSEIILQGIVDAAVRSGARLALPGEFTRRAFLNGRLDLLQAEAVIDLIRAGTTGGHQAALQQLCGNLSKEINDISRLLKDCAAQAEAILDFSEEDALESRFDISHLETASDAIKNLLSRAAESSFREGYQAVLAGLPNAGKSSIFNKLLNRSRSIVTALPGTTRNTIAETVTINGTVITLVDTAGLSSPRDEVEAEGIRRAREKLEDADIMVPVIDSSVPLREGDRVLLKRIRGKNFPVLLNKSDLPSAVSEAEIRREANDPPLVRVSAKTGEGMEEFRKVLAQCCSPASPSAPAPSPVPSGRHREILKRTLAALERGIGNNAARQPLDMIAADIRDALEALGEITGETATEDLLDRIFSRFCIGK